MTPTTILLSALAGAPLACPFGGAVYETQEPSAYRLEISGLAGDPTLRLRSATTGVDYAFRVDEGEGYSTATLTPARPAEGVAPIAIYALDDDMRWLDAFPKRDDPAPRYLAAPELGKALWNQAEQLGGPSLASGRRETLPRTFFVLKDCRQG
jgi:hypothetical protein